jgi:hypothetical protein
MSGSLSRGSSKSQILAQDDKQRLANLEQKVVAASFPPNLSFAHDQGDEIICARGERDKQTGWEQRMQSKRHQPAIIPSLRTPSKSITANLMYLMSGISNRCISSFRARQENAEEVFFATLSVRLSIKRRSWRTGRSPSGQSNATLSNFRP